MTHPPLKLALLWHFHQPVYRNSEGVYQMPWIRFHGTRDYLDMGLLLRRYPDVRAVINLVPSLLTQLDDYVRGHAKDTVWILSEIPAEELSGDQRAHILETFFNANIQTMITPYPRYHQLYLKYRYEGRDLPREERAENFGPQEMRDLQVWYNLTWMGMESRQRPAIAALFRKGEQFTEADKSILFAETREILSEVVPLFRDLSRSGQVELSTSPFYHPVLPLVIDNRIARESHPGTPLPPRPFTSREDAEQQVRDSLRYMERHFGTVPAGMWPPEGGLSEDAIELLARRQLRWTATDEVLLRHDPDAAADATTRFRPHRCERNGRAISLLFRDQALSEAIAYVYTSWHEDMAVSDLVARLHRIREEIVERHGEEALASHVVTLALEGDSCWHRYPQHGHPFLARLYQRLSEDALLDTVTLAAFLDGNPTHRPMDRLHPGSWINGEFNIWIGSEEDNLAWELIEETRRFLVGIEQEGILPPAALEEAWRHIHIAQGSDWCWWFGNEHTSVHDGEFDELFREHLMRVYDIAGRPKPAALYQAIRQRHFDPFTAVQPSGLIRPTIDGAVSHAGEWSAGAVYDSRKNGRSALTEQKSTIDRFYLGFDERTLFIRIDFFEPPDPMLEFVLDVKLPRPFQVLIAPLRGVIEIFEYAEEGMTKRVHAPTFKMVDVLECALPLHILRVKPGDPLGFQLIIKRYGEVMEPFPHTKIIKVPIPDDAQIEPPRS